MPESKTDTRHLKRLEHAVLLAVILLLIAAAGYRVGGVMGDAERVAFEVSVNNLRAAVGLEVARRLSHEGGFDSLTDMMGANPMAYAAPPHNYLGETSLEDPNLLQPGSWSYHSLDRVLIYRVGRESGFKGDLMYPPRVRFRIEPRYDDNDGDGRYDPHIDLLRAIRLKALDDYSWR